MEKRLITQKELAEGFWSITKKDKTLIEMQVMECGGALADSPDLPLRKAIRGFLAKMFCEIIPDNRFRSDIPAMASSFADGWTWADKMELDR